MTRVKTFTTKEEARKFQKNMVNKYGRKLGAIWYGYNLQAKAYTVEWYWQSKAYALPASTKPITKKGIRQ